MANRTSWVADAVGQGLTYGTLINSADMVSLANGSSVRSSVSAITNGTALAQFMDISFALILTSGTPPAGANVAFWIYNLNQDATHYGDNFLPTAGTAVSGTPSFPPAAIHGIPPVASTTNIYGTVTGIIIPPGSFTVAIQNNSNVAFTSGTQTVQYRTYNINLNA